jgi:hypothetical protein
MTAVVVVVILAGAIIAVRFANPDMTETELFLAYWPLWLICLFGLGLAAHIGAHK